VIVLEPAERLAFDLALIAGGGTGVHSVLEWTALVPHVNVPVHVSGDEAAAIGRISPSHWVDVEPLFREFGRESIQALLEKGILVREDSAADKRDRTFRDAGWWSTSAAMHFASRWRAADTAEVQQRFIEHFQNDLLDRLGPAPPPVRERVESSERQVLPRPPHTSLDALLDGRVTCRNFDPERALSQDDFAAVLWRTFGARVVDDYAPGVQLLKKGVPSAGGLHPTEAYLLVRLVDGIAPGLYHYHPVDHALEPLREVSIKEATDLAATFVGAQPYLLNAHVFVIPVSRFHRNFWKYRNHAKAYRALILDVGHLSQTMYLAATELGLAAFVTAAVNEIDIEGAFGLDQLEEGPLAICGLGIRSRERSEVEFDPLRAVWPV
jgi:putative peptide maturation dehydrogenase